MSRTITRSSGSGQRIKARIAYQKIADLECHRKDGRKVHVIIRSTSRKHVSCSKVHATGNIQKYIQSFPISSESISGIRIVRNSGKNKPVVLYELLWHERSCVKIGFLPKLLRHNFRFSKLRWYFLAVGLLSWHVSLDRFTHSLVNYHGH